MTIRIDTPIRTCSGRLQRDVLVSERKPHETSHRRGERQLRTAGVRKAANHLGPSRLHPREALD